MILVSAGNAPEHGLGLPVLRRNVPAHGASLARIFRRDEEENPSGPSGLVVQQGPEGAPPLAEDGAIESRLLPDVLPRGLFRPTGRSGHAGDVQVFENHDRVAFADRRRDLVEEVEALVRDLPVETGERLPGLRPVLRALLFPGQGSLKTLQPLFFFLEV